MNTITAKELRDNLQAITKRVQAGEHIQVTYRNKPSFKIEPINNLVKSDKLAGLNAFLKAEKKPVSKRYQTGDLKKLYAEDMAKKYGIDQE